MVGKILLILCITIAVLVLIALLVLRVIIPRIIAGQQLKLQYDNTPPTPHKLDLNGASFLNVLSNEEYTRLEQWLPQATIAEIQSKLKGRSLSVEQLTAFYAERILKMDKDFNSVIRLSPTVMEEARSQDRAIQNNEAFKDLTGVIILAKDNIAVKGMNSSSGSYALADLSTSRHSFLVQTMVDKGALILGKANLSEFSNFMSSPSANGFSTLGGQTRAAYGRYDVGGSSSGSSVAASLGFATVTLGSETAGSLIHPAGQNSVVAIKPTTGLLSRDLIIPISEAQDTAGVIGRTVSDVYTVFKASLVRDPNDPLSAYHDTLDSEDATQPLSPDYLQGKRLGIVNRSHNNEREMAAIQNDLSRLGAELVDVSLPPSQTKLLDVLLYGIRHDLNAFLSNLAVSTANNSLEKIVAYNKEEESRAPFGQHYLEQGLQFSMSAEQYEKTVETNRAMTASAIDRVMEQENLDAIVSISNDLSDVYASAHYPALTVPSGYRTNGEPYGVTFVAGLSDDLVLFRIAYSYEQGTMHRVEPISP